MIRTILSSLVVTIRKLRVEKGRRGRAYVGLPQRNIIFRDAQEGTRRERGGVTPVLLSSIFLFRVSFWGF